MFDHPLSVPVRLAVTATSLVLMVTSHRALFRDAAPRTRSLGALVFGILLAVAVAFAHVDSWTARLETFFPVGLALGLSAATASLFVAAARRAFDRLDDAEVRVALSFRAIYGALLLALAAVGHVSVRFGVSAGLGDMAVAGIAYVLGADLGRGGARWRRIVVHGVGLADMFMVLHLVVTHLAPWAAAHGNPTTMVTLPWLGVPLMFALNLHGLRAALTSRSVHAETGARSERTAAEREAIHAS